MEYYCIMEMKKRNTAIYKDRQKGMTYPALASRYGISVNRLQQIVAHEKEYYSWNELRRQLPLCAQKTILLFFENDESIFEHPERIAATVRRSYLLRHKNIGKKRIEIIASALAKEGCLLRE